jgi:N-acetylmuramoyl-L-alanine amidase
MINLSSITLKTLGLIAVIIIYFGENASAQSSFVTFQQEGKNFVTLESIKKFYSFTSLKRNGNNITLDKKGVVFKLSLGSEVCTLNNVKFICTFPISGDGTQIGISQLDLNKLIDPVLRPNYITNAGAFKTVILDAGHGGHDAGAMNAYGCEKEYNLAVANSLKKKLLAQGYKVILTRSNDIYLTLQERVNIANLVNENAIFVSIHFNSGGSQAHGIETFTLSPQGVAHYDAGIKASDFQQRTGNTHDSANVALATAIHSSVILSVNQKTTFDRGIKRARFSVLSGVKHPAVLLEGGFLSNPDESRLINNPAYIEAVSRGLNTAIAKYRNAVTRKTFTSKP